MCILADPWISLHGAGPAKKGESLLSESDTNKPEEKVAPLSLHAHQSSPFMGSEVLVKGMSGGARLARDTYLGILVLLSSQLHEQIYP